MVCTSNKLAADIVGWGVGEKPRDFNAMYLDGPTQDETMINWHSQIGTADAFVISTCAMWCQPCRLFARESAEIVSDMAAEGINVRLFDWVYNDASASLPDRNDIQAWLASEWTSNPENVWFGGEITRNTGDVIDEIFEEYVSSSPGRLLVLNKDLVVQDSILFNGNSRVKAAIRQASSVPEPSSSVIVMSTIAFAVCRRRRLQD